MVRATFRAQTRSMEFSLGIGIVLALLCAFLSNLSFLFKHRGAVEAPRVDIRHPIASAVGLFRSRWFLIGWFVAAGAWVFHVLALMLAPLSVVQVVLASGLMLLAVMADRLFGFSLGRRQWIGMFAMAVGLGLITVTQPAMNGSHSTYSVAAMVAFEGLLLGIGALLVAGPRLVGVSRKNQGLALGAAAGVLFGVSGVAVKALTGALAVDGPMGVVTSPWLPLAAAVSVTAFYAAARALQDGEAVPVIAITGAASNIVGIAGGIAVFGDPVPGNTAGVLIQGAGFLLVVIAAALTPAPVRAARIETAPSS